MSYKYIDTHAHVNINAFKEDTEAVISKCKEEGVMMINVGTQQDTSKRAMELAEKYDNCYAIVGLHPVHTSASYHDESELGENMKAFTSRGEEFDIDYYRNLAKSNKVVAIGECGLDYYRLEKDTKAVQEKAFIEQIELANKLSLPLMIHTRDAKGNSVSAKADAGVGNVYDDTYEILKAHAKVRGNVHFYAGNYEQAKKFFDIGFSVSFTGVITFAKDYEEVVRNAPLDMIHGETDCPYVAPVPYRGQRCEPWMVQEVYKKIASIRGEDEEVVRAQLVDNAKRLYWSVA
ncbi:hydrolase TatD [Candidatus Kaiserbacteria bacterium CG10_big_fil_rev_8_21_14_0_10_44_10]|uniref:Hydrolase TatD n=1 Tax=Candidatus Kaiserbacteria bacterium CG10_big_fil_rev_8_21_14_0_10_44_10 TaxID=1974606 RepID=A0A2H0UID0_9BACT|nr:MAG: hydrolase TatD [Candidatus Kaiserbacteria bacterium CG10_big_fil_rev_8_21_14_0_10_44_10]